MKIQWIPTNQVKPYKNNAKIHDQEQVDLIKESIETNGFTQPIVIDENNEILAGHGRFCAALVLQLKEVPVYKVYNWPEAKKKAYRIMDNKSAESAWDFDKLKEEFHFLEDTDYFNFTGFDTSEITKIWDTQTTQKTKKYKQELEKEYICPKCNHHFKEVKNTEINRD